MLTLIWICHPAGLLNLYQHWFDVVHPGQRINKVHTERHGATVPPRTMWRSLSHRWINWITFCCSRSSQDKRLNLWILLVYNGDKKADKNGAGWLDRLLALNLIGRQLMCESKYRTSINFERDRRGFLLSSRRNYCRKFLELVNQMWAARQRRALITGNM